MSNFVVTENGIILNRTAAADGRVPLAAWDIGSASNTRFFSTESPEPQGGQSEEVSPRTLRGKWEVVCEVDSNQVLIASQGKVLGQVNRRAAAVLAPLLQGGLIDVEFQQTQEAGGQVSKALYVFGKVGTASNRQAVREPKTTREMRAFVALLACTMKALKAADQDPDRDCSESASGQEEEVDAEHASSLSAASWHKLPGAVQWDYATGSIGNTVNSDLINQLGSRTLTVLRQSGASMVSKDSSN